jgi:hypothetical protein
VRFVQWLVGLAVVTATGVGAVWLLAPREAARLREENAALERENAELVRVAQRLTGEQRVAEVHVIDQILAGQVVNGQVATADLTTIEFIELDRDCHPLPARRFVIGDDVVFFDALVVMFDQEKVAAGDPLRGKSLALFRRIYGEHQEPAQGFPIDPRGDVPNVYRVEPQPGELEQRLWSRFWDYAKDAELAARDGVRVAQGEAVYVPMRRGEVWTLTLANNGGLTLKLWRKDAAATLPATRALQ